MNKFKHIKDLGIGAYGIVTLAFDQGANEYVAIKKMKRPFYSWNECINLREAKSLKQLSHQNIVKLNEIIRQGTDLYFIFEYLEGGNLFQRMRDAEYQFTEDRIKNVAYQILCGLNYMHTNGFFHRDMKPENIMFRKSTVKVSDFGLAREIRSLPPYTDYVSTRWYRGPELLLRSTHYSSPVDIWAVGCIIAELFMKTPLFAGASEMDQLFKIFGVLGAPTPKSWPDGVKLMNDRQIRFPSTVASSVSLSELMPQASKEAIDFIEQLLQFNPETRPTAGQALRHRWFNGFQPVYDEEYTMHTGINKSLLSVMSNGGESKKDKKDIVFNTFRQDNQRGREDKRREEKKDDTIGARHSRQNSKGRVKLSSSPGMGSRGDDREEEDDDLFGFSDHTFTTSPSRKPHNQPFIYRRSQSPSYGSQPSLDTQPTLPKRGTTNSSYSGVKKSTAADDLSITQMMNYFEDQGKVTSGTTSPYSNFP
ncbi:putative serine/threonine protein kinase [Blattamonas nauphoetae]|uniref:Serine/threonine protein kinase n=1 Tax=Blattamonas nauphoetae TaxID=2049346 RepID=A0ABQ9Y9D8_9EUKA|nr:putative serine/threonine protein kinase [Blattamonas nauphoetae]